VYTFTKINAVAQNRQDSVFWQWYTAGSHMANVVGSPSSVVLVQHSEFCFGFSF